MKNTFIVCIEIKPIYKWTHAIQTCVVQGQLHFLFLRKMYYIKLELKLPFLKRRKLILQRGRDIFQYRKAHE